MRKISIISLTSSKKDAYQDLVKEYQKRLKPHLDLELIEIPALSFSSTNISEIKRKETLKVLKLLEKRSEADIFILSEEGVELDSVSFSRQIFSDTKPLVFIIAGFLGFDFSLLKAYPRLSLSKMTFLHDMARLILIEQIYRAWAIERGKTYHY